jgi:RNA polymerase-binding transcription factor DksA
MVADEGLERSSPNPRKPSVIAGEAGCDASATEQPPRGALIERDVTELTAVGRALGRLDDGSYGRCVDCELEIDPARLAVLPAAARCSFCQELFERRAATIPAP